MIEELIKLQGSCDNLPAQVQISDEISEAMQQAKLKRIQLEKEKIQVDTLTWIKSVEDKMNDDLVQPMSMVEYNIKQNIHDSIIADIKTKKMRIN